MFMRGLRLWLAALLLATLTIGAPLHQAAAHGMAHAHHATLVHTHSQPCPDCPAKPGDHAKACEMACAAAVAIMQILPARDWSPLAYAVRHEAASSRPPEGAITAPDPFPPKRPRIA